jgi:hypothetical protein
MDLDLVELTAEALMTPIGLFPASTTAGTASHASTSTSTGDGQYHPSVSYRYP